MKFNRDQSLERILESAVVVSWEDLMHGAQEGLIHIEYGFTPSGTLDYLKVWLSMDSRPLASGLRVLDVGFHISRYRCPLREWIPIGRTGTHFGISDAAPNLLLASEGSGPTRTAPGPNANARRKHGSRCPVERSLRLSWRSTHPACGLNSGHFLIYFLRAN